MNKIKMLVLGLASMLTLGFAASLSTPAYADYTCPTGTIRQGDPVSTPTQCNIDKEEEGSDLVSSVKTIINVILGVLSFVAVAIIILGGVSYMTSQGDPAKATKAKNTIVYAVIGLVVSLLAFAIVNFVIQEGGFGNGESTGATPTSLVA